MFKKVLIMLSIFFIASQVESSDAQQNLRYRGNIQVFLTSYARVVPSENIVMGNLVTNNDRFNGAAVIDQNQTTSQNEQLDQSFQCSEYGCCFGMGLCAYWATGSAPMAIATPVIVAVTAACMYPESMQ